MNTCLVTSHLTLISLAWRHIKSHGRGEPHDAWLRLRVRVRRGQRELAARHDLRSVLAARRAGADSNDKRQPQSNLSWRWMGLAEAHLKKGA